MKNKAHYIFHFFICLIISFFINLRGQIDYTSQMPDYFINHFHFDLFFFLKVFFFTFLCMLGMQIICKLLEKIKVKEMIIPYPKNMICVISFSLIFLSSLIFLFVYYPGSNMNDTLAIIENPIGMSSQHPIIYNLLLSCIYRLFFGLSHHANFSFFATSVIQIIMMSSILTYLIWWFHKTFKNKTSTILLMIYFVFTPMIANYNSVLIKDSLFSGILLLHIPLLYQIIDTKGECLNKISYLISLFGILLLTIYIRNNGIYIVILTMIILFIIERKQLLKLGIIFVALLLFGNLPNLLITNQKQLFQEKVSIPIQQIAYVVCYNPSSIHPTERNYFNDILDLETIQRNYNPYSVDSIKWNPDFDRKYFNQNKTKFIHTWFQLMTSNFENYVKSYFLQTYELWSIEKFNPIQSRFLGIDLQDVDFEHPIVNVQKKSIFPQKVQKKLEHFYQTTTIYFNNGTCFLFLLIILSYCIYRRKYQLLPLYISLFGIWITLMISAPISYAFRYMNAYGYILPFLILITIIYKEKEVID